MITKSTFILTTFRGAENTAGSEVYMLLAEFGDSKAKVTRTEISGILIVETILPHEEVIKTIRDIIESEPWRVRSMLRLFPVEQLVDSEIGLIIETVKPMLEKIGEDETFRITIEKRHTQITKEEIIKAVASLTNRKVDLNNPNWVILIEVIGAKTGISVIKPSQIISVTKLKRGDTV